jgi:UDP-glucose 4-epimerase
VRGLGQLVIILQFDTLALEYLWWGGQSEILNPVSGQGYSVLEVFECARRITGKPIRLRIESRRAGGSSRLIAEVTKVENLLR